MNSGAKILVAMSGGVDSSVTALLLRRAGFSVEGATLLLHPDTPEADPRLVELCRDLDIPLHVIPAAEEFERRVLIPAAEEYNSGRTPNPCCECNERLKFALLTGFARELGASALATGHYCVADGGCLRRGVDRNKDQSYFLYRLDRELLPFLRFPLGGMSKPEVREIAARAGLNVRNRPDSQDVCFAVPGECCGDTLLRRAGAAARPGRVLFSGKTVGRHPGIHRCTIGQRGGLGVALGVPAYVKSIDAASGDVELCTDRKELESAVFFLDRMNWQQTPVESGAELEIQIRYRSNPVACRIFPDGGTRWRIEPVFPVRSATPGQAGVLYRGDLLLGGGVISLE